MGDTSKPWNFCGWKMSRSVVKRYFAMVNICFLGLGTFICFDSVGALQQDLMDKFDISFSEFSLMYSVNAWANIIISPFGGFLIDRVFGIRFGTLFYGCVFTVGHLIYALGITIVTFWCSLFGRFINGVGHEFVYICLQLYSVYYFKGKELSMIMCTNISMARLGSSIVYAISEPLLLHVRQVWPGPADVGIVAFIVGSFMILTMGSGVILMIMTPKNSNQDSSEKNEKGDCNDPPPKIKFTELFKWPLQFWLITFLQISFVVSIYVFLPFTQKLFMTVSGLTMDQANIVTSFFSIIGAVLAPFIGIIIDKLGREVYFCQFGFFCGFLAHIILGFSSVSPYVSMFILSLSYGLFNGSVMPMMAIIIPEYKLGTAYGVALSFCNGSFALCIYLVGLTVDKYEYVGLAVFMMVMIAVGAVASVWLLLLDRRRNGILNISSVERKAILLAEKKKIKDEEAVPLKS